MTEEEWRRCHDPQPMLEYLQSIGRATDRKLRLFAVACCRLLFRKMRVHPWYERGVNVAECFADGAASTDDLQEVHGYPPSGWMSRISSELDCDLLTEINEWSGASDLAKHACWNATEHADGIVLADAAALNAAWAATQPGVVMPNDNGVSAARLASEQGRQCELLRDIFSPFAAATVYSDWLVWEGRTIPMLAQDIYEERRFEDLPILGDALEDGGCTDAALLDHLRGPGPHVRGCWALDLILGKE